MLTLETMLKAMRQMLSYGELKSGAMDFLPSRVTGYKEERREEASRTPKTKSPSGYVRRWDNKKGAYVYAKKE
jgi:hypothetical protein